MAPSEKYVTNIHFLVRFKKVNHHLQASWLNVTTNDPTSPFFSEIARLRQELEHANQSIDEKFGPIEEAGVDVVDLTGQVEDGRTRIVALEEDVARLSRKDDRRTLSP